MNIKNPSKTRDYAFQLCIVALALWVYWPTFTQGLSNYDDPLVVEPLRQIHSLSQYFQALRSGEIFDYQPLRDLSLWLDWALIRKFPSWNFHYQNIGYWTVILLLQYQILKQIFSTGWRARLTTALITVHPVFCSTLLWVSARKHILSSLFTFLTIELVFRFTRKFSRKPTLREMTTISLVFFLALLSQPIVILLPLALPLFSLYFSGSPISLIQALKRWAPLWIPLLLLSFIVGLLNSYYYGVTFENSDLTTTKFGHGIEAFQTFFSLMPLVVGRYLYQIFVPLMPSVTTYSFASKAGLIGLLLWAPVYFLSNGIKTPKNWIGILFFFLIIAPVSLIPNQNLGNDTYIFIAAFGIFIWIADPLMEKLSPYIRTNQQVRFKILGIAALVLLVLTLGTLTRGYVHEWDTTYDRIYSQVNREPTAIYYAQLGLRYLYDKRYEDAAWAMEESRRYPDQSTTSCYGSFLGFTTYRNPVLTPEVKEKIFTEESLTYYGVRLFAAFYEQDRNALHLSVAFLNSIPANTKTLTRAACCNFTPNIERLWELCSVIDKSIPLKLPEICALSFKSKKWATEHFFWSGNKASLERGNTE